MNGGFQSILLQTSCLTYKLENNHGRRTWQNLTLNSYSANVFDPDCLRPTFFSGLGVEYS